MKEIQKFRSKSAIEYLRKHGIIVNVKHFPLIMITHEAFTLDPETYKVNREDTKGGVGYWVTTKYALDRYIRMKNGNLPNRQGEYDLTNRQIYYLEISNLELDFVSDILRYFNFVSSDNSEIDQ